VVIVSVVVVSGTFVVCDDVDVAVELEVGGDGDDGDVGVGDGVGGDGDDGGVGFGVEGETVGSSVRFLCQDLNINTGGCGLKL